MKERHPFFWEKYRYQYSRLWLWDEFCCKFTRCGILVGTPMYFTCDEIYHRILWKHAYLLKKMDTNFPGSPHKMGFAAFSHAMEY